METALITGASSGIGRDLAYLFARDRYRLVLVARRKDAMDELARQCREQFGAESIVLEKDLSLASAPEEIFRELQSRGVEVNVLVNNAGFGLPGAFGKADLQSHLEVIEVNVLALVRLTHLFLPGMIDRKNGMIMNMASVAGFVAGPNMSMYYASKAFVVSFSLALAHELRTSGVSVTAVCPGPTRTGFQDRAGMADAKLWKLRQMSSQSVAQIAYDAMKRRKRIAVTGMMNKLTVAAARFMPRTWMTAVVGKLNRNR